MRRTFVFTTIACITWFACMGILFGQTRLADAEIEQLLADRVETYGKSVGIVVGIVDESGTRFFSHGTVRQGDTTRVGPSTVYEIGSITKVFTAILLADMVLKQEIRLDDPVANFLPDSVQVPQRNGVQITLENLAVQNSGLPRMPTNFAPADPHNPFVDYSVRQLYDFISGYTLNRDVGAKYEYSNIGTGLLGHALARHAGISYESMVVERICIPLGMADTRIALSEPQAQRFATGHNLGLEPVSNWDIPTLAGAGALRSTASDMLMFLAANIGLHETSLFPAMAMTHASRQETGVPDLAIGLGWHIFRKHGSEIIWHNGGTGGYRAFAGFDKSQQRGVVVLTNSANSADDIGFHVLNANYPLAKLEKPRREVAITPEILARYAGKYRLNPFMIVAIRQDGDALYAQLTGQGEVRIFPENENKFFFKIVDAQISFVSNESGDVGHLILHQNGIDQKAPKFE